MARVTRKTTDIPASEITPPEVYRDRRRFLQGGAALALATGLGLGCEPASTGAETGKPERGEKLAGYSKGPFSTRESLTEYRDITRYNNFYEFSTDKEGPARLARDFRTRPWTLELAGEVENPQTVAIEDLLKFPLEERIYRLRCVEAWSMVIPWVGFPLKLLLEQAQPTSRAKYVAFETLHDPEQMPGQKGGLFGGAGLDWPYVEGLRIDEAVHPLTLLAVGLYGEVLPNQNGAPIRLVVPWKYGFKSIKSIVKITLVENQPPTTWNLAAPREYGFYSNVNPGVPHPRWSQARERRIGEFRKRPTLMFNGYAEQVASLYKGMDLARFF